MVNLWDEKVSCDHCRKVLTLKNLSEHTKKLHGEDVPEKYTSTTNMSLVDMFSNFKRKATASDTSDNEPLRHKKVKASDIDTEGNTVAKSDEPPDKDKEHDVSRPTAAKSDIGSDEPTDKDAEPDVVIPESIKASKASESDELSQLKQQIQVLTASVNKLIDIKTVKESCKTLDSVCSGSGSSDSLTSEESMEVIKYARALDVVLKMLPSSEFELTEDGIKCICCSHNFLYDINLGTSFYRSSQPESFR